MNIPTVHNYHHYTAKNLTHVFLKFLGEKDSSWWRVFNTERFWHKKDGFCLFKIILIICNIRISLSAPVIMVFSNQGYLCVYSLHESLLWKIISWYGSWMALQVLRWVVSMSHGAAWSALCDGKLRLVSEYKWNMIDGSWPIMPCRESPQ